MPAIVRELKWLDRKKQQQTYDFGDLRGSLCRKWLSISASIEADMMRCPSRCGGRKDAMFDHRKTGFGLLCAVSFHVYRHARWAVQRNDITSQPSNRSKDQISEIIETDWFTLAIIGPIKHTNACFADWLNGVMSALCYIRLRSLREHDLLRWQCTTARL